jgi:Cupin domain
MHERFLRLCIQGKHIDAKAGDYVTVPTRSPHTFSNPFDEEAKFFNTFTPAHYINYFKLLHTMSQEGVPMNPEANKKAMAYFATRRVPCPLKSCLSIRILSLQEELPPGCCLRHSSFLSIPKNVCKKRTNGDPQYVVLVPSHNPKLPLGCHLEYTFYSL